MTRKAKEAPPNIYRGEGARGGCYVEITRGEKLDACGDPMAQLEVGWSCVVVVGGFLREPVEIPVSWLSELFAIAFDHKDGLAGFLAEHSYGGSESYALQCDPPAVTEKIS